MTAPRVSVILPTFNRLDFLPATLASLAAQDFTDWELIIADDGSAPATRRFIAALEDARISVQWLSHSGRPAVARNAALAVARGEYVAFLDSDDLWHPQKLHRQLQSLDSHARCEWSYTSFALIDAGGRLLARQPQSHTAVGGWILERLLREQTVIALPSVLVLRSALDELNGFNEQLVMCEDDELWLRLAERSAVDALSEPLTQVRRHDQHGGDDLTAWRDRRRMLEQALRRGAAPQCRALLSRQRAQAAVGLAASLMRARRGGEAWRTLAGSLTSGWRHRSWWRGVARCLLVMLRSAATPDVATLGLLSVLLCGLGAH
jgi:glycosyltransferase involved in cell wall biosynthesis